MKNHLKKVVVVSSLALAAGAFVVASRDSSPKNEPEAVAEAPSSQHTDLWAANTPRQGRSALPAIKGKPRATPVRIKDPFEDPNSAPLRNKKSKVNSGNGHKARKPINPKEEFMPDLTDIPTASNDPQMQPQPIKQQSRWIKELSGKNARIEMAAARKKVDACDQDHLEACTDRRNDPSVTIAGVVVQTETAQNGSAAAPRLEGEMARGSYVEDKPLVYLK